MLETIRTIILPTDFSELSDVALRTAAALARRDDATVHLVRSIRLPFLHTNYDINVPEAIWEGIRKGTNERMIESQRKLEEDGVSKVESIVTEAHQPDEAIANAARDLEADLVVMATHGRRGYRHAFLGSVTEQTIRTSPIPVLAVKGKGLGEGTIGRILLATDFSPHSGEATKLVRSLAMRFGADVDVVHVFEKIPDFLLYGSGEGLVLDDLARGKARGSLAGVVESLAKDGISITSHLIDGVAVEEISDKAEQLGADLIVMGTQGFTGFAHAVIGSVTERTMRLAPCSVLTTRVAAPDSQPAE